MKNTTWLAGALIALWFVPFSQAEELKTVRAAAALYDAKPADGSKYKNIGTLSKGAQVTVLQIQSEHAQVRVEGWASSGAFSKIPSLLAKVRRLVVLGESVELKNEPGGRSVARIHKEASIDMKNAKGKSVAAAVTGWVAASALGDAEPAPSGGPQVRFITTEGEFVVELDPARAPKTVENILSYTAKGYYEGTIFHRVIPGFMIQGGGYTADYAQKPTDPPVPIESSNGLKNVRGTVAMARTNDPNSATAQFFVNVVDNAFLNYQSPSNPGYTVFGRVVSGMDVVDKIRNIPTGAGGPFASDVPQTPVVIQKAVKLD